MHTRWTPAGLALALLLLLVATPAAAQEIDGFWPACGAPGDTVLIRGSDFADEPAVSIGGTSAEVLRSGDDAILCLVPDDLDRGAATVTVDDDDFADDFLVLAEGTPVVYRLSTDAGPAGLLVYVFGLRLHGGRVVFVDESGTTQAKADVEGGSGCSVFEVPEDLAPGTYTLIFTDPEALDTFDCPITFQVVKADDEMPLSLDPDLGALQPGAVPVGTTLALFGASLAAAEREARPVAIGGTDFGSAGSDVEVEVIWDDGTDTYEGEVLLRTDRVLFVAVPISLPEGEYTVSVVLDPDGDAETTDAGTYTAE